MMTKLLSIFLIFLVVHSVSANEENDNWPCYLKKCERNASNFNSCLFYHANRGLSYILAGDDDAGIPDFVPLDLHDITLGRNQRFKLYLRDVQIHGINYLDVYNMTWDLEKKQIFLELHFSNTIRMSADYSGRGQFQGENMNTNDGHLDFTYGNGQLTYTMDYKTTKYNDMDYATIDKCKATRKNAFVRYRLHKNQNEAKMDDELSTDKANKLDAALDAEINELTCYVINLAFRPLFYNFPIDLMFD